MREKAREWEERRESSRVYFANDRLAKRQVRLLLVQGAGYRVQGAGCRVQGAGCRVQDAGCRVQGAG